MRKCLLVGCGARGSGGLRISSGHLRVFNVSRTHEQHTWLFLVLRLHQKTSCRGMLSNMSFCTQQHNTQPLLRESGRLSAVLYATESTMRYEFAYDMAFL